MLIVGTALGKLCFVQQSKHTNIEVEIENLNQQGIALNLKKSELSNTLNFLSSSGYLDSVARRDLNMKRDGEIVISFPKVLSASEDLGSTDVRIKEKNLPNLEAWTKYFFRK